MKKIYIAGIVVSALVANAQIVRADSLLTRMQGNARDVGKHADEKKADIVEKAKEGQAHLEDLAVADAQRLKDLVEKKAAQLKEDGKHDAITAKDILVEELVCSAKRLSDGKLVNGDMRMDDATKGNRILLKIGSLFADGPDAEARKNLAIDYRLSAENDGSIYNYQILDLTKPADNQILRSVKLADLGLETDCSQHKKLMSVRDGAPKVDSDALQKTVEDKSNLAGDVKLLEKEAGKIRIH